MTNEAAVAGPVGEIVGDPGAHGRAIAIGAGHADLVGLLIVDMAAGRALVEAIAEARVDLGRLVIDLEAFDPAGVLVDPGVFHPFRRRPVKAAPHVLAEGAIFGGEAGDRVRTQHAAR